MAPTPKHRNSDDFLRPIPVWKPTPDGSISPWLKEIDPRCDSHRAGSRLPSRRRPPTPPAPSVCRSLPSVLTFLTKITEVRSCCKQRARPNSFYGAHKKLLYLKIQRVLTDLFIAWSAPSLLLTSTDDDVTLRTYTCRNRSQDGLPRARCRGGVPSLRKTRTCVNVHPGCVCE